MKKILYSFLWLATVGGFLFLTGCGEDIEGPVDNASIFTQVDGVDSTSVTGVAGETVTFTVAIDYGGESPDNLFILEDGAQIETFPLSNTPGSIQVNYDIPESETRSTIDLVAELRSGNDILDSETFTVNVNPATVVGIATGNSDFSILVQALQQADLVTTLQGDGPFTVFAPTNAAFETLLGDLGITADELLARSDLSDILLYHVVSGTEALSSSLTDGQEVATAQGLNVFVSVGADGSVMVNDANVTTADLMAGNGVVHVIDKVLLPLADISDYSAVLLAAPVGQNPGERTSDTFFSTETGLTYSVEDVVNGTGGISSADIDFGYYFGATNEASIASPSDYPSNVYDLGASGANWGTLNATTFRPLDGFAAADFDAIQANQGFRLGQEYEVAGADNEGTEITGLEVGDAFAFQTAEGRFGIVVVDEVAPGIESDKFIRISVKVD